MNDGDVDGDVGAVLNAECDVWTIVLTRSVMVECWLDVSADSITVRNETNRVFDEVVAIDVVNSMEMWALDDVRKDRHDNVASFLHVKFLLWGVVSEGDELVAATANRFVEVLFEELGDEFAADCEGDFVVGDAELLDSCCSSVLAPEAIVRTFRRSKFLKGDTGKLHHGCSHITVLDCNKSAVVDVIVVGGVVREVSAVDVVEH